MELPPLPKSFRLSPFLGQWIHWSRLAPCFWPGRGNRGDRVDPELAPIRAQGGVYAFMWATSSRKVSHTDPLVVYIGETSHFCGRMTDWRASAGFLGVRTPGHYAAYRWNKGPEDLWVAFFPLKRLANRRLAKHARLYYEIVAVEEYRVRHDRFPEVNEWELAKLD